MNITAYTGVQQEIWEPPVFAFSTAEGVEMRLECDAVVLAAGYIPNQALKDRLASKAGFVLEAGDCTAPGNILSAVTSGRKCALDF